MARGDDVSGIFTTQLQDSMDVRRGDLMEDDKWKITSVSWMHYVHAGYN